MKKKNIILLICLCSVVAALILGIVISSNLSGSNSSKVTLGEYLGIEVEMESIAITDADVRDTLLNEIVEKIELTDITNRSVRADDIANINYEGKIDGEAFSGGTGEDHDLRIGSGSFIPGFEDKIIGMRVGETKDITVTFPDPYQNNPGLAGQEAVFTVKVNSIQEIPAITDALIKELTEEEFSSVDKYNENLRVELEAQAEEYLEQEKRSAVWEKIVENATVEKLSKKKIEYYANWFDEYFTSLAASWGMELSEFVEASMGTDMKEYEKQMNEYAEGQATNIAIAEAIAKKENISVTDADYKAYISEQSISSDEEKKYSEEIRDGLLIEKVVEFVMGKAKVTMLD